jgi:outer membrane receptor protein involved in Fe transport
MAETRLYNDTYVVAPTGSYSRTNLNSFEWNTDALLTFSKDLSSDFKLNLNAGANNRIFQANGLGGSGANFQIQNLFALSNTLDPRPVDTYLRRKEVQSVYGFGDLSFKDAIFLNVTARNDWSSTLPQANRSYFYPSVGLSAILTQLVKLPKFFTYAKVRGSYAEVGNDTDPYNLSRIASINNGTISLSPTLPNANLRPESTRSTELGLELRMLNGNLRFDFTHYNTNTFDQLFASPVPVGSGVSSVFQNGADIQNRGFEFSLGGSLFAEKTFNWDIDLNFSRNRSTVLEISDGFDQLTQASDYIRIYKLVKGQPFGDIYSRGYVRDPQGNVVVDANGLPKITTGQDIKVANFNPDWLAGLNNSFRYKNFSLSTLVDIRKGGSFISFTEAIQSAAGVLDYTQQGRDGSLVFGSNIYTDVNAVTESGAPNTIKVSSERLWNHIGGVGAPVGESFVRDATNVRLRELVLGYQLPSSLIAKTPFKSARASLVGRNLFFIYNKADYVDPEMVTDVANSSEGRESLSLPTTRTFGLSLNFGF